jgi:hypothetical protein
MPQKILRGDASLLKVDALVNSFELRGNRVEKKLYVYFFLGKSIKF